MRQSQIPYPIDSKEKTVDYRGGNIVNILVIHSHNANRGDEAAVKAMVDELLIKYPGATITISNNGFTPYPGMPENVIQIDRFPKLESRIAQLEFFIVLLFKGKFALTKEARKFIRALKEADVVLHAPGGPSIGDTYFKAEKLYLWRLNLIRRMGIPYIFYAPSMGPFNCASRNKLRKEVISGAERIILRDPISVKYVKDFLPGVEVEQALDSALQHDIDIDTGELISIEYQSRNHAETSPSELYIRANYRSNRMTIEFSSKILLADYLLLISTRTFRQCLSNIEMLDICQLDIDSIIDDCYFNKLHVTQDIDLKLTSEILNRLNQCTGDYRRYKWNRYQDAILFTRDVKAEDCRESISIYNKEVEINLSRNKPFLNRTGNAASILEYFQDKTRFEVKLENKRKIQKELSIDNTDYHSVMNASKNIILSQFDKIFTSNIPQSNTMQINNIVDYGLWCIIRYHNFDLKSIEQEIKDMKLYEDKTKGAMGKQMKKIRAMMQAYLNQNHDADAVIEGIRKMLME